MHMAHGKSDKNHTVALPRFRSMKARVGLEHDRGFGNIEQDARTRGTLDRPVHRARRVFLPNLTVGELTQGNYEIGEGIVVNVFVHAGLDIDKDSQGGKATPWKQAAEQLREDHNALRMRVARFA